MVVWNTPTCLLLGKYSGDFASNKQRRKMKADKHQKIKGTSYPFVHTWEQDLWQHLETTELVV